MSREPVSTPTDAPTMNPLAVVAIVAAFLGFSFAPIVGSIAAIICGRVAGRQIDTRGQGGAGVAKAAVILGVAGLGLVLLFVLFIAVLISTSSPPAS